MELFLIIFYYSFAILNAVVPMISIGFLDTILYFWLAIVTGILWVLTAAILGVALTVIKQTLKDRTNRVTNVFAMLLNFTGFCLFALQ